MKITIEFRNPNHQHCDVAVFINGALTGILKLQQDDLFSFQQILFNGAIKGLDEVISRGRTNPTETED